MSGLDVANRALQAVTDYRLETFREPITDGARLLLNPSDWDDLCALHADWYPGESRHIEPTDTLWGLTVQISDSVPAGEPRVIAPE